ncbi:hypothetical protein PG988_013767 [Apiospora saccharicola]
MWNRPEVVGWFAGGPADNADAIARGAFERGKEILRTDLPEKHYNKILSSKGTTIQEFMFTLFEVQARHQSQKESKSMKAVVNHAELVKGLAKACSRIADSLPHADLSLILYPKPAMRKAVARLYAAIIKFATRALRWYQQGKGKHLLSAIASPWSLHYEEELRDIDQSSRSVQDLAQSASRAELRELRFQVHQSRSDQQQARLELIDLKTTVENGFKTVTQHFLETGNATVAQDALVEIIGALRRDGLAVLWALRPPNLQDSTLTTIDIIRILLYQALQVNTSAAGFEFPITVAQLREASSHDDWLALFKRALQGCPTIYVVFDPELLNHVTNCDQTTAAKFLTDFAAALGPGRVKVIVSSRTFRVEEAEQSMGADSVVAIRLPQQPVDRLDGLKRRRARKAAKRNRR